MRKAIFALMIVLFAWQANAFPGCIRDFATGQIIWCPGK